MFTRPIWPFTPPIWVFTLARSGCSRSADLAVHARPIWLFTTDRNPHIVLRQGTQALEGLVKGGDVAGLQKLGLNAIDAKILIADVQAKGFDQVFTLFSAHKAIGGALSSQAGGQQFVSQSAGRR